MPNVIIVRNTYPDLVSLGRVLNYVKCSDYVGGYAVNPNNAFTEMCLIKEAYHKLEGVQLKHFLITFSIDEFAGLDFEDLYNLAIDVGHIFKEYQIVFGIHVGKNQVHVHFCMNTVSFLDGKKYSEGLAGFNRVKGHLMRIYPQFYTEVIFREKYEPEK